MWPQLETLQVVTVATSFESAGSLYGPFLLDKYALTWIIEGGGTTYLGEHQCKTRPGSVMTMRPGTPLRHNWGSRRSLQSFIVFDVAKWPRPWPRPEAWVVQKDMNGSETFFEIWRYLLSVSHSQHQSQLEKPVVELLLRMFLSGMMGTEQPAFTELPRTVSRALDFLAARLDKSSELPSLGAIAKAAGVSPQHLCRLFTQELDATPLQCAEMIRIEKAAGLLERTDASLAELAELLNYSSAFHLSKNFKKMYGIPPRDYRTAFRGGLASRPGGLVYKNHRLRSYLYERGPGRILLAEKR